MVGDSLLRAELWGVYKRPTNQHAEENQADQYYTNQIMELGGLITGLIFSSYKPTQMKLLERLEYHFPLMARWRELRSQETRLRTVSRRYF